MAYEIASYLAWVLNPNLLEHCARKSAAPDWDPERYAQFLARNWMLRAARAYLGRHVSEREVRELANMATRVAAGREFVEQVVSGEWRVEDSSLAVRRIGTNGVPQ